MKLPELTLFIESLVGQRASFKYTALKSLGICHVHDGLIPIRLALSLAEAFPDIVDLCLTYCDANRVLSICKHGDEFDAPFDDPKWLRLRTMSLSSADVSIVCSAIASRKAVGCPIIKLRLGLSLFHEVTADERMWLRDRVHLEAFNERES
jgi:hypothetical protein